MSFIPSYQENRYYSPLTDCDMVRISMFNEHGHEWFTMIPANDGKKYREARMTAVEMLYTALTMPGSQPGEVVAQ